MQHQNPKYQDFDDPQEDAEYSSDEEELTGIDLSNIEDSDEEDDKEVKFDEETQASLHQIENVPAHTDDSHPIENVSSPRYESRHTYVSWEEINKVLSKSNAPQATPKTNAPQVTPKSPITSRKPQKIEEERYTEEESKRFDRIKQRVTERYEELQKKDEQIKIARDNLKRANARLETAQKNRDIIQSKINEHFEKAINEDNSQKHREIVPKLGDMLDQLDEAIIALTTAINKFKAKFDHHNCVLEQRISEQETNKEMSRKEKFSKGKKAAKSSIIHPVQVIKAKTRASTNKSVDAKEYRKLFAVMKSATVKVERTLRKTAVECSAPDVGIRLQLNNPGYGLFDQHQKTETAAKVSERPSSPGPK